VALDRIGGREVAALVEDGRLADLLVEASGPLAPGAVCRAVLGRAMKGQGGAMLRLPGGATGFLRRAAGRSPGDAITVQVTAWPEPGKAPPVTDRPLFKGRHAIVTPDAPGLNASRRLRDDAERDRLLEIAHAAMEGSAMGLILRSAAEGAAAESVAAEIAALREAAEVVMGDAGREPVLLLEAEGPHALAWREWAAPADVDEGPGSFERHGVLEALDALRGPRVPLGEATAFVEPTRALVAVDVNTGGDASMAAGLKANLACARELPRQLRLRGLGGQVVVDPAPMPKRERRVFEDALRAACRACPVETTLVGWTPLGHYELTRRRERVPLSVLEVP
jgi:Ribonuclease G/E